MRQKKEKCRWQRWGTAAAAVLFLLGTWWMNAGEAPLAGVVPWRERLALTVVEQAVGAISPALGQGWRLARGKETWLSEPSQAEALLRQEVEAMVLREQAGGEFAQDTPLQEMPVQQETEAGTTEAGTTAESALLLPEDGDELLVQGREWDADLLAEIDRENEALRQQADSQTEGFAQNPAGDPAQDPAGSQQGTSLLQLPYSMEQLSSRDFLVKNIYHVHKTTQISDGLLEAAVMLAQDMKLQEPDSGGPKVLIHHTHATEYFADSDDKEASTLIVGVGDYLEELLETQYGIQVIHDRTVYPYNEAYSRALKNVEKILEENPTIEVFIDLHRDAGGSKKYTVNVDGKETANLMFFNGLSYNVNGPIDYLPNENLESNLAFSFQMKMAGDSLYPGLCKRNYLKAYRYNLHVLPRAVIVEVGDNNNTLQEAKNAMEPLARILYYVLTGES